MGHDAGGDAQQGTRTSGVLWLIVAAIVVALAAIGLTAWLMSSDDANDATPVSEPDPVETTTTDPAPPEPVVTIDGLHVAVAPAPFDAPPGATGSIHTSRDGIAWGSIDIDASPHGVAADEEMIVVVGEPIENKAENGADDPQDPDSLDPGSQDPDSQDADSQNAGLVIISRDGLDWSETHAVPDVLTSVTRGADRWLATGSDSQGDADGGYLADAVIYSSVDAVTWEKIATIPTEGPHYNELGTLSIAHGPGGYIATGSECLGDACTLLMFRSADGTIWEPERSLEMAGASVASREGSWALIGGRGHDLSGYTPVSGTSSNGVDWDIVDLEPSSPMINDMAPTASGWIGLVPGFSAESSATVLWMSEDLVTWAEGPTIDDVITGIVVVGASSTDSAGS